MKKRLLVIDDEPGHRLMVRAVMEDNDWDVFEAESGEEGLAFLKADFVHVVLLDIRMPGMNGEEALARIHDLHPELPVVMLTAYGTVGSAVEAMKKGAFDYLTKPADNDDLSAVLEKAGAYSLLVAENRDLRHRLRQADSGRRIVGSSPSILRLLDFIRQAGPSEATVLILGESGTGKELIAEALHEASTRRRKALVKVNCAALPADLLESELFGYVKGAFTGAVKDKPGRFQLARGGTLFLDEIAEIPMALQAKLLRALQDRVVEPLGAICPVEVDVRIIAATNRDLRGAVEANNFRNDLFFRLNVLEVVSPPLRDRMEDLPLLVDHLMDKLCQKNRKEVRNVSQELFDALAAYHWPGNVRELENVLERALILSRSDTLDSGALPSELLQAVKHGASAAAVTDEEETLSSFDDAERATLVSALRAHGGHREKSADALGISRRTLQYKLKKFGLTRREHSR